MLDRLTNWYYIKIEIEFQIYFFLIPKKHRWRTCCPSMFVQGPISWFTFILPSIQADRKCRIFAFINCVCIRSSLSCTLLVLLILPNKNEFWEIEDRSRNVSQHQSCFASSSAKIFFILLSDMTLIPAWRSTTKNCGFARSRLSVRLPSTFIIKSSCCADSIRIVRHRHPSFTSSSSSSSSVCIISQSVERISIVISVTETSRIRSLLTIQYTQIVLKCNHY